MSTNFGSQADAKSINVRVLFFGAAREATGKAEYKLSLEPPVTAQGALVELCQIFPDLLRFGRSLLIAVNQEYAGADLEVGDGDELAVFPPVSGGAEVVESRPARNFVELTTHPINVGAIARRIVLPECGATVTLDGYAREWTGGRRTLHLIYEAYAPMALTEMERLVQQAHEKFEIAHMGIVHRTGKLEIGETSVVIAVGAPHRAAAFAACEWAIRELKRTVPIWKKEVYADGEEWVAGF